VLVLVLALVQEQELHELQEQVLVLQVLALAQQQ
jgi:hypothetical protein